MTPDQIIITVAGALLIAFIYWFFLMKRTKAVPAVGAIDIIVDGGYTPETITAKKGKPITLNFLRKDPSSCLEEVALSDFKIRKFLPLNEKVSIKLTPEKAGEFQFACGINMFHGKIIVK